MAKLQSLDHCLRCKMMMNLSRIGARKRWIATGRATHNSEFSADLEELQGQVMCHQSTSAGIHISHLKDDIAAALNEDERLDTAARVVILASLLKRCGKIKALSDGRLVHAYINRFNYGRNRFLGNWLVKMYGDCGSMDDARAMFEKLPNHNSFSWNILINAYAKNGFSTEALECFYQMQNSGIKPDRVTFICALDACASAAALEKGHGIHGAIVECGYEEQVVVGTALVNMYGKCGSLEDARSVFDRMPHRNVVSWSAMMAAYVQNGHAKEALECFHQMQLCGIKPDQVTFVSAIDACAVLAALEKGQEIHTAIVDRGYEGQVVVGTALVNMYGKCGSLEDAGTVFWRMADRNAVSWGAMIAACAKNGHSQEALDLFKQMQCHGFKPDHITFLSVLTACSHTGRVDDARHYFSSMSRDHGIQPKLEHYMCLIDILGRAGNLDDAENLINSTPFKNLARAWLCLLSACKVHGDVDRGARVARHIFKLDPKNAVPYVLLSSIYAAAGRWDETQKLREVLQQQQPGYCHSEIGKSIHDYGNEANQILI
ncbi:hypothetical protein O6H91_03G031200 [Diphasiastrum complanatum]|uniref:Uncharacterized protein n=2 Tax=Diphasiastrum complanatum TaxID=34168 RepID=A0ACC2E525_DIPCM|nr:hypothetical protein O6H91_03G031200 [Diphasiastrum complanatum]